ncbi:hypothetical protein [Terasakiella pusilla]|uniref:hypothetical protein n=1 Tax=Terasakiella pusilla TaxID=64973 RepID=UPI003AA880A6
MLVDTKSIIINTDYDTLFTFLSQEENAPKWAIHYCLSIRKVGDDYLVMTPEGEMFIEIISDVKTGIVDMRCGPTKDEMLTFPARVTALPDGSCLFCLTCIMLKDLTDEELTALRHSFQEEFQALVKAVA